MSVPFQKGMCAELEGREQMSVIKGHEVGLQDQDYLEKFPLHYTIDSLGLETLSFISRCTTMLLWLLKNQTSGFSFFCYG